MALVVRWTFTAQRDRERVFKYWNKNNGSNDYSRKLNQLIEEKITIIRSYPAAGLATNRKGIRYYLIDRRYKLFYKKNREQVIILRFWDSRQDTERLTGLNYPK